MVGFGLLAVILIISFGVLALRFDVAVAGAVAGWIGMLASLFLIKMGLRDSSMVGIALGLNLLMTVIALVRYALNPY